MNNLFSQLLVYRPREWQTPLENFMTELFCEIMDRCPCFKESILQYFWDQLGLTFPTENKFWRVKIQYCIPKEKSIIEIL